MAGFTQKVRPISLSKLIRIVTTADRTFGGHPFVLLRLARPITDDISRDNEDGIKSEYAVCLAMVKFRVRNP